ncbi:hypothetical protein BVX98_04075 [bacterium F11]|nr:hypothetical protein BVX98_04075 [bacterium F11]
MKQKLKILKELPFMKLTRVLTIVMIGSFLGMARAEEPPARFDFVRPLGMGGAFAAIADDHNIFNFNPAGMVQRTGPEITILEISGGVSEDTLDVLDFVSDNEDILTDFDDPNIPQETKDAVIAEIENDITKLDPRIYVGADIASYVSGPNGIGGLPFHVGFGAFGVVDSSFLLELGPSRQPLISYDIHNDIVIPVSIAKRYDAPWIIPGKIGIGVTGKGIQRYRVKNERINVTTLDELDPPIADGFGIGMDLGILHQINDRLNLGIMVHDFLGTNMSFDKVTGENGFSSLPKRDTVIRPRTDVGIAVFPEKLFFILPTHNRWSFALDVRDILVKDEHLFFEGGIDKPFGDNLYTHIHMGTEFKYAMFRFRGGINEGYPTIGLGLDLPLVKLDYAFYNREIGPRAGDRRQGNHIASIAFRFGAGNVEAREKIIKAKERKKQQKMASPDEVPEAEPAEEPSAEESDKGAEKTEASDKTTPEQAKPAESEAPTAAEEIPE